MHAARDPGRSSNERPPQSIGVTGQGGRGTRQAPLASNWGPTIEHVIARPSPRNSTVGGFAIPVLLLLALSSSVTGSDGQTDTGSESAREAGQAAEARKRSIAEIRKVVLSTQEQLYADELDATDVLASLVAILDQMPPHSTSRVGSALSTEWVKYELSTPNDPMRVTVSLGSPENQKKVIVFVSTPEAPYLKHELTVARSEFKLFVGWQGEKIQYCAASMNASVIASSADVAAHAGQGAMRIGATLEFRERVRKWTEIVTVPSTGRDGAPRAKLILQPSIEVEAPPLQKNPAVPVVVDALRRLQGN